MVRRSTRASLSSLRGGGLRMRASETRDTTSFAVSVVGATRVDAQFFNAFDTRILAGRAFQSGDYSPPSSAVIINRSLARSLFGSANPLGRRIRAAVLEPSSASRAVPAAPWEEIVGVVSDFPVDSGPMAPKTYRPLLATDADPVVIAVRARSVSPFGNRLRELTVAMNPMLRVDNIRTLEHHHAPAARDRHSIRRRRWAASRVDECSLTRLRAGCHRHRARRCRGVCLRLGAGRRLDQTRRCRPAAGSRGVDDRRRDSRRSPPSEPALRIQPTEALRSE